MSTYGALGEPLKECLDPPDYGDYEKDEGYLDNMEADYSPADAAMDEAIEELDGKILEDEK